MIAENQAAILQAILDAQPDPLPESTVYDRFGRDAEYTVRDLRRQGLITVIDFAEPSGLRLRPAGHQALMEYLSAAQKAEEQRAKEEHDHALSQEREDKARSKDARRSWVQFAISAVLSVASFFAGAITEMLTSFMEWISALFH